MSSVLFLVNIQQGADYDDNALGNQPKPDCLPQGIQVDVNDFTIYTRLIINNQGEMRWAQYDYIDHCTVVSLSELGTRPQFWT